MRRYLACFAAEGSAYAKTWQNGTAESTDPIEPRCILKAARSASGQEGEDVYHFSGQPHTLSEDMAPTTQLFPAFHYFTPSRCFRPIGDYATIRAALPLTDNEQFPLLLPTKSEFLFIN